VDQSDWRGGGRKIRKRLSELASRASAATHRRTLLLERLEQRHLLSGVSLQPIAGPDGNSTFDIPSGKDLFIPLLGSDSGAGTTVSYSATSSNSGVEVQVLPSGTNVLQFQVSGTNPNLITSTNTTGAFSGVLDFELFSTIAPNTVKAIEALVTAGDYNSAAFYRAETGTGFQLLQGGLGGNASQFPVIPDEINANASFNSSGLLAMANAGPESATTEFFLTAPGVPLDQAPIGSLNYGYTIFGQLLAGQDIYNDIASEPTTPSNGIDQLNNPIFISQATIGTSQSAVLQISEPSNFTGNANITVTATASDNSAPVTQTFAVSAALPSMASGTGGQVTLAPINNQTTTEGKAVTFTVSAADTGGGTPTFSVTTPFIAATTPSTSYNPFTVAPTNANANATVAVTQGPAGTATVTVTPAAGFTGAISLVAHADDSSAHDAETFTVTVAPPPTVDLQVSTTDSLFEGLAFAGAQITYTVTVTNNGQNVATGASIVDALPALTNVTYTAVQTGGANNFTASGTGAIHDTAVNMPPRSTITYTVRGTISTTATGSVSNTVTVSPPSGFSLVNPNNATAGTNVATDTVSLTTGTVFKPLQSVADSNTLTDNNLRSAIAASNADTGSGTDAIVLQSGTYDLTLGELNITGTSHALIIEGQGSTGPNATIITQTVLDRVLAVAANAPVILENLAIEGGTAQTDANGGVTEADGGGILNAGILTLNNVAVINNKAQAALPGLNASGGGIYSTGLLMISGTDPTTSLIQNNSAIATATTISGPGAQGTGGGIFSNSISQVSISNTTVSGNLAQGANGFDGSSSGAAGTKGGQATGGGIYLNNTSSAPLVLLQGDIISNNSAMSGNGGAGGTGSNGGNGTEALGGGVEIDKGGTGGAEFINDTISGNKAVGGVGGAAGTGGVGGNGGDGVGGGIDDSSLSGSALFNVTLYGNSAIGGNGVNAGGGFGGGIDDDGSAGLFIANSTITANAATPGTGTTTPNSGFGGGVNNDQSSDKQLQFVNTLVAGNTGTEADGLDVGGAVANSDNDLIGDGTGSTGFSTTNKDLVGTTAAPINALLGTLTNNGGNLPTVALGTNSPALGAGDTGPISSNASELGTDERGLVRPVNGQVDIGALQTQLQAGLTITNTDPGAGHVVPGNSITYTITVTNTGPNEAKGVTVADFLPASLTGVTVTSQTSGSATATGSAPTLTGNTISDLSLDMPSGSVVTYTVKGTVSASATGSLVTTATVTPPSGVVDANSNIAVDTDTITPQADLKITNSDGPGIVSAIPGQTIQYTVVVTNTGPSNVTGAQVSDVISNMLSGVTVTAVSSAGVTGSAPTLTGNTITDPSVNLPVNGTITYTVKGTINSSATGSLIATATVSAPSGVTDPVTTNNSVTDTDNLTPQADLQITQVDTAAGTSSGATGNIVSGQQMTYTIVVTNAGPSDSTGASISDMLPTGFTVTDYKVAETKNASGFATTLTGNNISDTVNMPAGSTITYTVTGTVSATSGKLTNVATVAAGAGATDTNTANNSATDSDNVLTPTDLSITNTDNATTVVPGQPVTYTIVVTNTGSSDASGISVLDTLPAALTGATFKAVATGTASGFTASGTGSIHDQSLSISAHSSVTYTLTATVDPTATGSLVTTASLTAPTGLDTNAGNNSATDTDTLTPQADLKITNTHPLAGTGVPGTAVSYTITVTNAGPSSVSGASVIDVFPGMLSGVKYTASATGTASGFTASGTGNINDTITIAPGSTITYSVTGTVISSATGTITDTATVAVPSGVTDTNTTNNSATTTVTLVPNADLAITNTDSLKGTALPGQTDVYTIVVTNKGPSDVSGASIVDTLPSLLTNAKFTAVGSTGTSGFTASGTGSIDDTSVNIPAGGTVTYTVTATISAAAANSVSNTATVTAPSGTVDSPTTNNSATVTDSLAFASLAGTAYDDIHQNGNLVSTDPTLKGIVITLTGTDANSKAVSLTTTTASDGTYSFANLVSGTYTLTATMPASLSSGIGTAGLVTPAGSSTGTASGTVSGDSVGTITLGPGAAGTGFNFGAFGLAPKMISTNYIALFSASAPSTANILSPITITGLANETVTAGTSTPIPFTFSDALSPTSDLTVNVTSSDPTNVPAVYTASATGGTITVTPPSGASGDSAMVTATVTDSFGDETALEFSVLVSAASSSATSNVAPLALQNFVASPASASNSAVSNASTASTAATDSMFGQIGSSDTATSQQSATDQALASEDLWA
jgi:uncharacterized repeat protein (TIGR01451 family)